jgi:membrane associated rhomboid family serine protease
MLSYSFLLVMSCLVYCTEGAVRPPLLFQSNKSLALRKIPLQLKSQSKRIQRQFMIAIKRLRLYRWRDRFEEISCTDVIIFLNIVVFIATKGIPSIFLNYPLIKPNESLLNSLMKSNKGIRAGEVSRLGTALFCHGDIFHLFFNTYAISQSAAVFEIIFGPLHLATIYFLSGVGANLGTYICNVSHFSIGASACIFGLYGALLSRYNFSEGGNSYKLNMELIKRQFLVNMIYGLSSKKIDNAAHFFGFVAGALLEYTLF